jgi:hypothetical protein
MNVKSRDGFLGWLTYYNCLTNFEGNIGRRWALILPL